MFEHFPFLAVFLALAALTIAPGVDTVLVLRNAGRGGFDYGIVTSLGICSGLFVHATLSSLGLSVILLQSSQLFSLLKYAGALYLLFWPFSLCGPRGGAKAWLLRRKDLCAGHGCQGPFAKGSSPMC